jgi:heptosyltransferase III
MLKDQVDLRGVRRVLVIKLRHHGDVLLASPVFSVLKNHAPQVEVDALVYADTSEMLTQHPAIGSVHVVDRRWKSLRPMSQLAAEWRLFRDLRARRYDLVVHLSEHPRGAWLARLLGARHAVAPDYAGRSGWWKRSFTHRFSMAKNPRRHMVEWNLDALRRIGIQPEESEKRLALVAGVEAEAQAAALLAQCGLAEGRFIHLHPGSRWQFKCWPAERTAALIDELQRGGARVVLTAAPSPDEGQLIARILAQVERPPVSFAGKLSLKALAAVARRAQLFIGVDSAPMHIAAAVGTPVVALFGPSGDLEWGPWGVPHRVVGSQLHPCRPCGNDGCGCGKVSDCLVTLPVSAVLEAARELLPAR